MKGTSSRNVLVAGVSLIALATAAAADAQTTTTYTYDALGRLTNTSVTGGASNGSQSGYGYDAAGNRQNMSISTPTPTPTPPPTPTPTPATIGNVANAHFTEPAIAGGQFQYGPMGGNGWYFSGATGVQSDGSAWGFSNVYDGDARSGFIQGDNTAIVLVVSNLTVGATYRVNFKIAKRYSYPINPVYVAALNNNLGVHSTTFGGWQQVNTATFVATQASGNIVFNGTIAGGDYAIGIDDVSVTPA